MPQDRLRDWPDRQGRQLSVLSCILPETRSAAVTSSYAGGAPNRAGSPVVSTAIWHSRACGWSDRRHTNIAATCAAFCDRIAFQAVLTT